jgi:hypothetical protein
MSEMSYRGSPYEEGIDLLKAENERLRFALEMIKEWKDTGFNLKPQTLAEQALQEEGNSNGE